MVGHDCLCHLQPVWPFLTLCTDSEGPFSHRTMLTLEEKGAPHFFGVYILAVCIGIGVGVGALAFYIHKCVYIGVPYNKLLLDENSIPEWCATT